MTVRLWWGGLTLWLGPWRAGEIFPTWRASRDKAPDRWGGLVATTWMLTSPVETDAEAMDAVEHVVAGQLRAVGVPEITVKRADGSTMRIRG